MKASVVREVEARDRGCIAPLIAPRDVGPCRDEWGKLMSRVDLSKVERDHWDWRGRGKERPNATAAQVILGCPGHHRGTGPVGPGQGWLATSEGRQEIAKYIEKWLARSRRLSTESTGLSTESS